MVLLSENRFLGEAMKLMERSKTGTGSDSVFITMKKYTSKEDKKVRCLIRLKHGSSRISTHVDEDNKDTFMLQFSNIFKGEIDGLKKRERSKKPTKPTKSVSKKNKMK